MARGVASHRPPFGQKNSISGYNLFVSAYHGFAQLGNEHIPELMMFEPFPIFSLDYLDCSAVDGGLLRLRFRLTLCGTNDAVGCWISSRLEILDVAATQG